MQGVVINKCEKFHDYRLRNDRDLGNRKSDNNNKKKNKNNVRGHWGHPRFLKRGWALVIDWLTLVRVQGALGGRNFSRRLSVTPTT